MTPHRAALPLALLLAAPLAVAAAPPRYVPLADTSARCLDGSPYAYIICAGARPLRNYKIDIQGGGWCYNETDCLERAGTRLGSSSTWAKAAAATTCEPAAGEASVQLWYCDGAWAARTVRCWWRR
jgi:hypothetical protein